MLRSPESTLTKISQPHDRFLKELLSHPERAGALLRERLPREVVRVLSDKPPELVDASFVDEALDGHLSDLLYNLNLASSLRHGVTTHSGRSWRGNLFTRCRCGTRQLAETVTTSPSLDP